MEAARWWQLGSMLAAVALLAAGGIALARPHTVPAPSVDIDLRDTVPSAGPSDGTDRPTEPPGPRPTAPVIVPPSVVEVVPDQRGSDDIEQPDTVDGNDGDDAPAADGDDDQDRGIDDGDDDDDPDDDDPDDDDDDDDDDPDDDDDDPDDDED